MNNSTHLRISMLALLFCVMTSLFAQDINVKGVVKDEAGEPIIGATIQVQGSKSSGTITDLDGNFTLKCNPNATLNISYIGFDAQSVSLKGRTNVIINLKPSTKTLNEVVVTAMGIMRKEESLTYATQKVKAEDLMRVQDPNVANSLEGKVSGVVITPSAGGAGGASKIILRGNKSILGNSSPLIVLDGIPLNNSTKGTGLNGSNITAETGAVGGDALSMINPDDIESMNILKGANAAALYGSAAANGVIMITTKKGREGRLDVSYTSNVTFDSPLLTPKLQNTYGATIQGNSISKESWGDKVTSRAADNLILHPRYDVDTYGNSNTYDVHLRNYVKDDIADFYRTGVTTNNSVSVSAGTDKVSTYFSYANSHANGMIRSNSYNRNTLAFRQSYNLLKNRVHFNVSANYVNSRTTNRIGGGQNMNPIYHLYTAPRNIDMDYYRNNTVIENGTWLSGNQSLYQYDAQQRMYTYRTVRTALTGPMQQWALTGGGVNNPYWLLGHRTGTSREDRFYGFVQGDADIYDGLKIQVRLSMDKSWGHNNSRVYASAGLPNTLDPYGRFWLTNSRSTEYYTDYLLSYNKQISDFSLSATAGWVDHTIKSEDQNTAVTATYLDPLQREASTLINDFSTDAGDRGATSTSITSDWNKAALFTAQVGWQDKVYIDGSYRRDWYRAFRQFKGRGTPQSYGYFGLGANAIVSSLVKLPKVIDYLKYRVSYSEVGNSIPNIVFARGTYNRFTKTFSPTRYSSFANPIPEKTKSFETGIEATFFDSRLGLDLTFYNSIVEHLYLTYTSSAGAIIPANSGRVRNQGFEGTVSYDFKFGKNLRWRTSYNLSYNANKILDMGQDENGQDFIMSNIVGGAQVLYKKGGSIGDMYVNDFQRDENGHIRLNSSGVPQFENNKYSVYAGNMNSKWQMGWTNTLTYKGFVLSMLINGRIGGKVISLTEATLDQLGLSERTGAARLAAEANNLRYGSVAGMQLNDGSGRVVPIQDYYVAISQQPLSYIYSATNFRLRELSFGYTFRDLLGTNKNLNISFIARNLFFIYKDAPVDPDVSLAAGNGLSAFEMFNMPSSRSFGFNLKVNF